MRLVLEITDGYARLLDLSARLFALRFERGSPLGGSRMCFSISFLHGFDI